MKRRDFIKIIAATGVAAAIPSQLFAGTPTNAAEAVKWFERHFECSMGAPWAFVEPQTAGFVDRPEESSWWVLYEDRDYKGLTPYNTYKIQAPNEAIGAEALCALFGDVIRRYPSIAGSKLYWRLKDKIQAKHISRRIGGDLVVNAEQLDDDPCLAAQCAAEGMERNDEDGSFYRNRRTETFTAVRTRIAVPEMQRLGEQDTFMHAGWIIDK